MPMRISLGSRIEISNMNTANGYGYATDRMLASLARLGHEVNINDADAEVEIWFDQPQHWVLRKGQYTIGYHPWESTKLREDLKWSGIMNQCDEIWTPSHLIANWYRRCGVTVPTYVYLHGVDPVWSPVERESGKIRFLHVGAEAARKGGWDTLRAFRKAFPENNDVELTLKMNGIGWGIERIGKTSIINRKMPLAELIGLYHSHHIYVYPSWGEGFGLTPLQAMATGMPTITNPAWAPYANLMDPNLSLVSSLRKSPWQEVHPGEMFRVDQDDLIDRMRWVVDNYDDAVQFSEAQLPLINAQYDWDILTKNTFELLASRLENKSKISGLRTFA